MQSSTSYKTLFTALLCLFVASEAYSQTFEQVIARYNIGGTQLTLNGDIWGAEQYVTSTSGNTWSVSGVDIDNTDLDTLYQTERFGDFSYEIPVSQSGLYQVKLYFAEVHHGVANSNGVGARIFDVELEGGQGQLTDYDIVGQTGASARAIVETFEVDVSDGYVSIDFSTDIDNAKLSALEVFALDNPAKLVNTPNMLVQADSSQSMTISATDLDGDSITLSVLGLPSFASFTDLGNGSATLSATPDSADIGEYSITISAWDSIGAVDQQSIRIWVTDPEAVDLIKINAAGPEVVKNGETWIEDQYGDPGITHQFYNVAIEVTTNDSIYQSERHGDFSYEIPVPQEGIYEVRLHFAELWHGISNSLGIGARVFNVDVEGQDQLSNYDIIQEAGAPGVATVEVLQATVNDGFLTIDFSSVVNEAKIGAIEVFGHYPPQIASPNIIVEEGDSINYQINSFDLDGDLVTLSVTGLPGFANFADNGDGTGTMTVDPDIGDKGDYQVSISGTDADGFTTTGEMTVYVRDQNRLELTRVNSGGPTLTLDGTLWGLDQYGNPGDDWQAYSVAIDGTEVDSIYQSERNGDFTYEIPVPEAGLYQVNLHMAELWFGVSTENAVGERIFNVDIEDGQHILTNYDIVVAAGMPALATVEVFEVMVVDSFLTIDFSSVVNNAKISAIEVFSNFAPIVGAPNLSIDEGDSTAIPITATDPDDDAITLSVSGMPGFASFTDNGDGTGTLSVNPDTATATAYNMTAIATDSDGLSSQADFTVWVNKTDQDVKLINTGGPQVTHNSRTWLAGQYYTGGKIYKNDTLSIAGTENDAIYRSERYETHSYSIPVDSGVYQVRLHFAELWNGVQNSSGIGARVFDVDIENGQGQLDNYDIIKEAGGPVIATVEQFDVEVNDGNLTIDLTSVVDNAKISAIEVVEVDTTGIEQGLVADAVEYQALVDLYNTTDGDNWSNNRGDSWLNGTTIDDLHNWSGVSVVEGDVYLLLLPSSGLNGQLPSSIGNLNGLRTLWLEGNQLSGTIPDEIGLLKNLKHLYLGWNSLEGSIPNSIGEMVSLRTINLLYNNLSGPIPSQITELDSLYSLYLGFNQLTGKIPENIGDIETLQSLALYNNQISGEIPASIGNLTNLTSLLLQFNQLSGELPEELGDMTDLRRLYAYNNNFTGSIPAHLGRATSLTSLQLGQNNLSGLPDSMKYLENLRTLTLSNNNFTGTIPSWIGDLTELHFLTLHANKFTGSIPTTVGALVDLEKFWVNNNQLNGSLPSQIGSMTNLYTIYLHDNNFTGTIPSSFSQLTKLEEFRVHNNSLEGDFPSYFVDLDSLVDLVIIGNKFTSFPDFSNHGKAQEMILKIRNNELGFSDIEANFTGANTHPFSIFEYDPQSNSSIDTSLVSSGQVVVLNASESASQMNYQWQIGVNGSWANIDGATSSSYSTSLLPDQLDLQLRCKKTNNWVTDLTIYSKEFVHYLSGGLPDLAENLPDGTSTAPGIDSITNKPLSNTTNPDALNYVRTKTPRSAITSKTTVNGTPAIADVQTATQFIDGLGRPIQTVIKEESPGGNDILQPIVYDAFGREEKQYLPYTHDATTNAGAYRSNALLEQYNFYHAASDNIANTDHPFTQNGFEPSPRGQLLSQAAPGESWRFGSGHEVKFTSRSNAAATDGLIRVWQVSGPTVLPNTLDTYADGTLFVSETKDEHNQLVIQFTDILQRVILKKVQYDEDSASAPLFLETAYVYDDLNNLRHVIPPEAMEQIKDQNDYGLASDPSFADKWLFSYKYDGRQRMIEKKIPGAEPVTLIYNARDLLVMSQDGNQAVNNQWTFTKYDQLNRPIMTGFLTDGRAISSIQSDIDSQTAFYESTQGTGTGYTLGNSFPSTTETDLLTITYYDDYSFPHGSDTDFDYVQELGNGTESSSTHGLATGGMIKELDSNTWLKSVSYYDVYGRVLQALTHNILGEVDRSTSVFDYVGNVLETQTIYNVGATEETKIYREFTYDDTDRLVSVDHKIDTDSTITILENDYNELGELISKDLGVDGSESLQTVNYEYNIRGWLTQVNDAELSTAGDYFGMELHYDYGYEDNEFNGNIAGIRWQSALDEVQRTHGYLYDPVNRITGAAYLAKGGSSWDQEVDHYDMGSVTYDANGNILTLARNGLANYDSNGDPVHALLDSMSYNYQGNQLQVVNDQVTNGAKDRGDFYDGAENSTEYDYDENGNMKTDDNKGIAHIGYNYLNLPDSVYFEDGKYIKYLYDATGIKHQQQVYDGGELTKITEYVGELIYEDSTLAYIHHEEGRIVPDTSGFEYQYYHKDHLGNIRMTFTAPKAAVEYQATMETDSSSVEEAEFHNIAETRQLDAAQANNGTASARLNGDDDQIIGPAKSLAVGKGDTVKIEVYAKYNQATNNTTTLVSGLAAAVNDAFGLVGSGETQVAYDAISSLLSAGSGLVSSDDDIPLAYVNYLMFNEDYLLVDFGYQQVSTTALNNPHELLSLTTVALQNGFMYIYLTNESALDLDVFFDDLTISHTESPILQENHYYPFGLTMMGLGKQGSNPWKYNGKEEQDELDLVLYDYQARYYDPALGRFINIDPAADLMRRHSPYNYAFDNPIRFTDPDGMIPTCDNPPCKGEELLDGVQEAKNDAKKLFSKEGLQEIKEGFVQLSEDFVTDIAGILDDLDIKNGGGGNFVQSKGSGEGPTRDFDDNDGKTKQQAETNINSFIVVRNIASVENTVITNLADMLDFVMEVEERTGIIEKAVSNSNDVSGAEIKEEKRGKLIIVKIGPKGDTTRQVSPGASNSTATQIDTIRLKR